MTSSPATAMAPRSLFHDDGCDHRLDVNGRCPACRFTVDAQSTQLADQCQAWANAKRCARPINHSGSHRIGDVWWRDDGTLLCGELIELSQTGGKRVCARTRGHDGRHSEVEMQVELRPAACGADALIGPCTLSYGHGGAHQATILVDATAPWRWGDLSKATQPRPSPDELWLAAKAINPKTPEAVSKRFIDMMVQHGWIVDIGQIDDALMKGWGEVSKQLRSGMLSLIDREQLAAAVKAMGAVCEDVLKKLAP